MIYDLRSFDGVELKKYAEFLASKIITAKRNPFKSVLIDGAETEENYCHDNVTFFVEDNASYKRKNGWLIANYVDERRLDFYCHAVVEDCNGNLFDITLRESGQRDFIESFISDDKFKVISDRLGIPKISHYYS